MMRLILSFVGLFLFLFANASPLDFEWQDFRYWDSTRTRTELDVLTLRLEDGQISRADLMFWNQLVLYSDAFDIWRSHRQPFYQKIDVQRSPFQAEFKNLNWLYAPWNAQLLQSMEAEDLGDSVLWQMARSELLLYLETLNSGASTRPSLASLKELQPPKANLDIDFHRVIQYGAWGILIYLLLHTIIRWRFITQSQAKPNPKKFQTLSQCIQSDKPSALSGVAISELRFRLFESEIATRSVQAAKWNSLTDKQRLTLYLFSENHSVEDCCEFLAISKGHLYNLRSEMRRHFNLQDGQSFSEIWI